MYSRIMRRLSPLAQRLPELLQRAVSGSQTTTAFPSSSLTSLKLSSPMLNLYRPRVFFSTSTQANDAALTPKALPKQIKVTHVRQVHKSPFKKDQDRLEKEKPQLYNAIIESQYKVFNFLRKKDNPIVVMESVVEDFTPLDFLYEKQAVALCQFAFSRGFPQDAASLNQMQKKLLHDFGGVKVLFYLGFLKYIYKSIEEKVLDEVSNEVHKHAMDAASFITLPPEAMHLVLDVREKMAISFCREVGLKCSKPEVEVFLVFGGYHEFQPIIDQYFGKDLCYAGAYDFHRSVDSTTPKILSQSDASLFSPPRPIAINYEAIDSEELKVVIENLSELIEAGKLKVQEIKCLYQEKSTAIKALQYYNFSSAFHAGYLSLEELKKLSLPQINSLKNKYQGAELKEKVSALVNENKPAIGMSSSPGK